MQLKFFLVFVAIAAFCVAESLAARNQRDLTHLRNKRAINKLINNAKKLVEKGINKVKEIAQKALKSLQDVEGTILGAGNKVLGAIGVKLDLLEISKLAKSELQGCAAQESVKEKANTIKNDILSCAGDIEKIKVAAADVKNLLDSAQNVPELLKEAVQICKTGGSWFLSRVIKCGKAIANVATKGKLTSIPGLIMKHMDTVKGIANTIKAAPSCLSGKLSSSGQALRSLATEIGTCAKDGVTTNQATIDGLNSLSNIASNIPELLKNIPSLLG